VGGVVLEAYFDAEFREFVGVSGADDNITSHPGVCHLANDILVGRPDNKSILGRIELVLVLSAQASSSLIIGLTVLSSLKLGLVSLKVSLVLLDLNQPIGSLLSSILIFSGHFFVFSNYL